MLYYTIAINKYLHIIVYIEGMKQQIYILYRVT